MNLSRDVQQNAHASWVGMFLPAADCSHRAEALLAPETVSNL
jgi:hypothetical protein